jgi:hypothetical protein
VAAAQETPYKSPAGGVTRTAHAAPFHRSATAPGPELELAYDPAAVHAAADVHDTDSRGPICAPGNDACGSTAQPFPFQTSANAGPPL